MANDLQARDYVLVLQSDHRFDLCVAHGCLPRRELSLEGLQRIDLLGLFVGHLVDHAKAALS